ncbi:LolA family protein [Shimia ponticola]|uniref:LolA family protein n=1 Tax=Shimia ponticola TaxID=2582893 RepID=UPI0011BF0280|nr:outer membrane lipoprotein carrier protein LolA [Shimia ponticola]
MDLTRRSVMASAFAVGLAATLPSMAFAQKLPLGTLSQYLNGLQTAQGAFTQVNADGSVSTGTIYIKRPGRVRFEYAPPEKTMVIAGGGQLAVFDARSDEPTRYPLRETPLSIILADNVNLGRANMVTGHTVDGPTTKVRAQDPENPEYGSIDLVFTGNPVQLRQWVINDGQGGSTTVILGDLQIGGRVPERLFNIRAEMRDWAN